MIRIIRNKKSKQAAQSQLQDIFCQSTFALLLEKRTKRRDGGDNFHYRFTAYYHHSVVDITLLVAVVTGWKLSTIDTTDHKLVVLDGVYSLVQLEALYLAVWGAGWREHITSMNYLDQITFGITSPV